MEGVKLMIKLVLWDAGGTLVRTRRKVGEYYSDVAKEFGFVLDSEQVHKRFKITFMQMKGRKAETIPQNGDDRAWWKQLVQKCTPDLKWEPQFESFFEDVYSRFENPEWWSLFPDVLPLLDFFKQQRIRQAVLSNWDSRLNPILEGLQIGDYFEKRWISAEQGLEKPNPLFYQKAMKEMKVSPEETLVIGDDPLNDDQAPRSLGCQTYLLKRPEIDLKPLLNSFFACAPSADGVLTGESPAG